MDTTDKIRPISAKQRRRRKQKVTLAILLVVLVLMIAVLSFLVVKRFSESRVVEGPQLNLDTTAEQTAEATEQGSAQPVEETQILDSGAALEQLGTLPSISDEYLDPACWNTSSEVERTIDFDVISPDFRLTAVPESERLSIEHFNTVTFVGDSITQGLYIYDEGLPNAQFCAYKNSGPNSFVNKMTLTNVNGNQEIALDALAASQPDAVYVMLGMNSLSGNGDESYFNYYAKMLDMFREVLDPRVPIYVESMTPTTAETSAARPALASSYIREVNNRLSAIATEKGCYFIDLYDAMLDDTGYMNPEYAASDGIHMNPTGYAHWVEYIRTHVAYNRLNKYEDGNPYAIV